MRLSFLMLWTWPVVGTMLLFLVIAAFSTPAGVGGGLLFTPLLQILLGYTPKEAVPLSQVLITGASIGSLLYQVVWQLLHKDKPLNVQTMYIWFILPAILAGSVAGVLLARISPSIIQLILLVLICGYAAVTIYKRALKTFRQENGEAATPSVATYQNHVDDLQPKVIGAITSADDISPTTGQSTPRRKDNDTLRCIFFIFSLFIFYVIMILLRGSKSMPSIAGITYCGTVYWALYLIPFIIFIATSLFMAPKEEKVIATVIAAGALATMSGISGGIVLNPIFLSRGLTPQQSSATAIVIVTVISTASTFDFLTSGQVPIWDAMFTMQCTFVGSIIGMTAVAAIIKRSGRQSFLLFILGTLVALGCALTFSLGVHHLISNFNSGVNPFALQSVC